MLANMIFRVRAVAPECGRVRLQQEALVRPGPWPALPLSHNDESWRLCPGSQVGGKNIGFSTLLWDKQWPQFMTERLTWFRPTSPNVTNRDATKFIMAASSRPRIWVDWFAIAWLFDDRKLKLAYCFCTPLVACCAAGMRNQKVIHSSITTC